jgi:hypothetical protein
MLSINNWGGMAMTTILRVEHTVSNFDDWKKVFDNDPLGRKKSGVRRYRIMRQLDNTSFVMLDLEFDDQKEAEAFADKLRNLWVSAQGQKLMQYPQLRIVDPIESKEL